MRGRDRHKDSAPTGARSVQIEGSVQASVIITGDGNIVTFAPPPRGDTAPAGPGTDALYPALLRVRGLRGEPVGVGFLVGPRTALTCAHVLEAARAPHGTVYVDFPFLSPNAPLVARPVQEDRAADVAVLELEGDLPPGVAPVPLKEGGDLWGHPFRAFGFPEGHPDGVWASGVIRGPNARGQLQIEDTKATGYRVQRGFSGSPVWDDRLGGVVGMVVAAEGDPGVRAALIIPVPTLRRFCPDVPAERPALLPPNPFADVLAVKDPARFVGRERLLERALRWLEAGSVALVGERKVGKSSVLWQLRRRLEATWEVVLFWDFFEPVPARALLREAVAQLGGNGEDWEALRAAVGGRRVVLLLDELDLALERGFDLDVLRGCRALCQKEPGFRLVTASRICPRDIFRQTWESLPAATRGSWPWDFLQVLEVGPFTEEEARRLLDHPWAPDAPRFDEATCRELIALSGRYPYRLQRAAHHRYEALADPAYDWRAGYARDMEALE